MFRIQSINAVGCRGIKNGPKIEIEKGGLLLCGDSGTGKSSFVDVIEKVLTTKCGSLDTGNQGTSWSKQGTHIEVDRPQIELKLSDETEGITLTLETDRSTLSLNAQSLLEAAEQNTFILRRRTLLDFINAKPAERYVKMQGFFKLDAYLGFEDGVKALASELSEAVRTEASKLSVEEKALQVIFGKEVDIQDDTAQIAGINLILDGVTLPITAIAQIIERVPVLDSKIASIGNVEALVALQNLATKLKAIPEEQPLALTFGEYEKTLRELLAEESRLRCHFYNELLETGSRWITEDDLSSCPLCEQDIDNVKQLQERIQQRLLENANVLRLRKSNKEKQEDAKNEVTAVITAVEQVFSDKKLPSTRTKQLSEHAERLKAVLNAVSNNRPEEIRQTKEEVAKGELDNLVKNLRKECQEALGAIPESNKYSKLVDAKAKLIALTEKRAKIKEIAGQKDKLARNLAIMERICGYAETARKKAIRELLDAITEQADAYFQKIHPGESIGNPKLEIPERGTGSVVLKSKFYDEVSDPRGRYSEGHVDSLGLCLFLAIRRLHYSQRPELAILVLDDVLHSVDGQHRQATAELVFREFKDHQIIITTHDTLWFDHLKTAAKTYASDRRFTQKRIARWSLTEGPIFGDSLSEYEWLVSQEGIRAKPADRISKAGRFLEEMLQTLCDREVLRIAVPFSIDGKYTLDPLWTSFYNHVKNKMGFMIAAKEPICKIENLRSLRNLAGAHWNPSASGLTDQESTEFTDAVILLRQLAYCDECGTYICRVPQIGDVWSCSCQEIQYNNGKPPSAKHPKMNLPAGQPCGISDK